MVTITNYIEQFVKEKHYTTKVNDAYGFFKLHDLSIKDMINLCGGLPVEDTQITLLKLKLRMRML